MFNTSLRDNLAKTLQDTIRQYPDFKTAFEYFEPLVLGAVGAERISIFQRRSQQRDLVSHYKTGTETREIKVAINPQSIAGFVAMAQQPVLVNNPYNEEELRDIHYKLRFDQRFDRITQYKTRSILCVPIKNSGLLLGVIEIVNKEQGSFTKSDLSLVTEVADIIGEVYRLEIGGSSRMFDLLIQSGAVDHEAIKHFSKNSNVAQMVHSLHHEHDVPEKQICASLAAYYQVPFIDYLPDQFTLAIANIKLNMSYLKRNNVAVIKDEKARIVVLMFDPNNTSLLMEIESAIGNDEYQLAFSLPSYILKYLGEETIKQDTSELSNILDEIEINDPQEDEKVQESMAEDEPAIVRLVQNILYEARRLGASDIHIDAEHNRPTLVRMRVDGEVRDINQIPETHHLAVVARIKIMSGLNIAEKRIPQDGKLIFTMSGQNIEVRVATIPTVVGEGVVMRILAGGGALPLEKINMSPHNEKTIKSTVAMPHGIVLVVGPTGSGKTTTLHAILGHLNTPNRKIWTAEDPVEITQYRLQQVQVNPQTGFTYAKALRAFLRADPDIILIGEMRDKETAHAGIEASLTGHLVLSTLHTNSAPETITRLLDLGMDPVNFSDACLGILAQRLIKTLCKNCKEEYNPSETELDFLKRQYGEELFPELNLPDDFKICRAKGCKDCDDTGYTGRTGVHELLTMTPELRGLIYKGSSIPEMKKQAIADGMRTLTQDAIYKVIKGDIDIPQMQVLSGTSF